MEGRITNWRSREPSIPRVTVTPSAEPAPPVDTGGMTVVARAQPPRHPAVMPNPRIVRPVGLPRATHPGTVPSPEHHHLPGWVRRTHGQAQPVLADLLGGLEGERRGELAARLDELTAAINSGKFSQAWSYPKVIEAGQALLTAQRAEQAEQGRRHHTVEVSKRRVSEELSENAPRLRSEAAARFNRALRSATDPQSVASIGTEVKRAVDAVRTVEERRREREIGRTRAKIQRTLPRSAASAAPAETWQETLRRFAERQAAEKA